MIFLQREIDKSKPILFIMITQLGRFVQIPIEVYLDKKLNGTDIRIYGWIHSFVSHGKPFYGSNEYLAELFDLSKPTVLRSLSKLKDAGLIKVVKFDGRKRHLSTKVYTDVRSDKDEKIVMLDLPCEDDSDMSDQGSRK